MAFLVSERVSAREGTWDWRQQTEEDILLQACTSGPSLNTSL